VAPLVSPFLLDLVGHDVPGDAAFRDPTDESRLSAWETAPDPVVVDECRSRFGREVSDEEARAAMGIGGDGVDLAAAEVEP
jgi:hypothetical protein